MNQTFTINHKYGNIERNRTREVVRPARRRRRRLGHALGYFNGGNALRFYFNLIFK